MIFKIPFRTYFLRITVAIFLFAPLLAKAEKIRIITTTPTLAWAAKQIVGDAGDVEALLRPSDDPHYADASPRFIRRVAEADILCFNGLELEVGWLPKVLGKSGNAKVQPGGVGYCDASAGIEARDKPTHSIDRSMGDLHAAGNPHYCLDPDQLKIASRNILAKLITVAPAQQVYFSERQKALEQRLDGVKVKIKAMLSKRMDRPALEYHKEFTYFLLAYGVPILGSLEETPGVPPSAGRIASVATLAKTKKASGLVAAHYSPERVLAKFSELSGVRTQKLDTFVSDLEADAYERLQLKIVHFLLESR